ncbi:hypothetical protein DFH08DRAFT_704944 [Mycena albidolilacea]|uniref:Polysaccharide biosynthesis domain-containing protein n=1 Tax=Mycena albidolilacea TaxID=1033008 RepID=A0AAD6ZTP2_9AGAR|nr:hypothetical protein DFH08DRAFT_704944 [Mycena albidolilacea]
MLTPPLDRIDDEIYEDTLKTFPELADNDHAKLVKLDEERMKNPEGKEWWKVFIDAHRYKKKVIDHNFGSLIRTDARQEYGKNNTIFGTLRAWSFLYVPFPRVPLSR